MSERPIIMQAESVLAILEGRKTQTRRVIKPQPRKRDYPISVISPSLGDTEQVFRTWLDRTQDGKSACCEDFNPDYWRCPYGLPGDLLWVKEALYREGWGISNDAVAYKADGEYAWDVTRPAQWVWKRDNLSPLFMPWGLRRLTLRLTDVRVQRVQEIEYDDCIAEGIEQRWTCLNPGIGSYAMDNDVLDDFASLWDSINAKRGYGWDTNPWVWALAFEIVHERKEQQ